MRIAALDVGEKRIGIAVCDEMEIIASGVESYTRTGNDRKDLAYIANKLEELGAKRVVIGLPLKLDGSEGIAAEKIRDFAFQLSKYTEIEQAYQDERMTTAQAQRILIGADVKRKKRKNVIDKMAAQLILQAYMDTKGGVRT